VGAEERVGHLGVSKPKDYKSFRQVRDASIFLL
jgi:hypothetical protein